MKIKTWIVVGTFFLSLCSGSSIQAQQEDDDPNWRERKLEGLKKRIEEEKKKCEEAQKELEKMRGQFPHSRFLDIYDYGPSRMQFLHIYDKGPSPAFNSRFLEIYDYGPSPQKRRRV